MEKRTLLIIAFVFFALGASIELLKNLGRNSRVARVIDRSERQLEDYNVRLGTDNVPAPVIRPTLHAAAVTKPITGVPVAAAKKADDKKAKVAKADTKKKDEKKKKKKKKKKKATDTKSDEQQVAQNNKKLDPKSQLGYGNNSYYVNGFEDPNAQNQPDKEQIDWEKILLGEPTTKDIQNFIEHHRSHGVSDQQYFQIVKAMIKDTRPNIRDFSLVLLDAAPSTYGFIILSETFFHEPANSDFRNKLQKEILEFARVESFMFLSGALDKNNSDAVHIVTMNTISRAVENYRPQLTQAQSTNTSASTAPATPTNPTSPAPASANTTGTAARNSTTGTRLSLRQIVSAFTRFQNPLKTLVTEKDPDTAKQASDLLVVINSIVALNPTSTTTTPTNTPAIR